MIPRLFFLLSLASPILAQDGPQLYALYCSACHGADGKGATGGTFPPLAGSPWVLDAPERPVKVILNGIHGPIDILGKSYNLEMPPQGAMLPDDQIAAILTHVRSSWGNNADAVSTDTVKAIRAAAAARVTPWTSEELLKLHPLPLEKTALKNLISRTYQGEWTDLPDFSKLKSLNVEEEHDGILTIDDAPVKDLFAMDWEGSFEAPAAGDYTFLLDADDAARIIIDGKPVVAVTGIGPIGGGRAKQGKVTLAAGAHTFRAEYLEYRGVEGIALAWKGPGAPEWKWLSDPINIPKPPKPAILIGPKDGRPIIYRNFVHGTTPRAIAVGFPGDLNLAYSADNLAPELLWTGNFIDAGHKWIARGTASNPPAGENLVKLSSKRTLPENARFKGYKLDSAGNPTFIVSIGNQILTDSWRAGTTGAGAQSQPALIRKVSVNGNGPFVKIAISDQLAVKMIGDHEYSIGTEVVLRTEHFHPENDGGKLFVTIPAGQSAILTYRWIQ